MARYQTKSQGQKNGLSSLPKAPHGLPVRQRVSPNAFRKLMGILQKLDAAKIHHSLSSYRTDAVSVTAVVPGERWEIDVLESGEVDFERFKTSGDLGDENELKDCIQTFAER